MSDDPIEWEFGVPASKVDLQRIYDELGGCVAIQAACYMSALRRNAPTVYRRLWGWAKERNLMTWWTMNQAEPFAPYIRVSHYTAEEMTPPPGTDYVTLKPKESI